MQPTSRPRLIAIGAFLVGFAGWWYNWHLVKTTGSFYIKLTLLGPLALFTGLLFLFRPEWTGPIRSDSTREHKLALFAGILFMALGAGIDFYFLNNYNHAPHP